MSKYILYITLYFFLHTITIFSQTLSSKIEKDILNTENQTSQNDILTRAPSIGTLNQLQIAFAFSYTNNAYTLPGAIQESDSVDTAFYIEYSILKNLELNLNILLSYKNSVIITEDNEQFLEDYGLGDVSFGFTWEINSETENLPRLIYETKIIFPTGKNLLDDNINSSEEFELGQGIFGWTNTITMGKSIDPIYLFISLGYQYNFKRKERNIGNAFIYTLGSSFSINNKVALRLGITGRVINSTFFNDIKISKTQKISFLNLGISYRLSENVYIFPDINIGLTEASSDYSIDIILAYTF